MVDKHEIYSNGTEYVPIFRMKQWFEHCKAQSANAKRYIDADALRHRVLYFADARNLNGNHEQAKAYNHCLIMIDESKTADVVDRNECLKCVFYPFKQLREQVVHEEWIPCSERLPQENGRYLVTRGLNACGSLWNRVYIVNYSDLMGLKSEKIWWQGNVGKLDFERIDDVIAWMPLPQPWRERREDELHK